MHTKPITTLAIEPGTRQFGVAVFEGRTLCFYAVKSIRRRGTPQELFREVRGVAAKLIAEYRPDDLVLKRVIVLQKSLALTAVMTDEIATAAAERGLSVRAYSAAEVRERLCGSERPTRSDTVTRVIEVYPELVRYRDKRTYWERLYYTRMFEAVALGLAHIEGREADDQISNGTPLGNVA